MRGAPTELYPDPPVTPRYAILRFHVDESRDVVRINLTLEQAIAYCEDPETHNINEGWYDGYELQSNALVREYKEYLERQRLQEGCEGEDGCLGPVVDTHRGMRVCKFCKSHWIAQDHSDTEYMKYDDPHPNIYND